MNGQPWFSSLPGVTVIIVAQLCRPYQLDGVERAGKYEPSRVVVVLSTNETIRMFDIVDIFLLELAVCGLEVSLEALSPKGKGFIDWETNGLCRQVR